MMHLFVEGTPQQRELQHSFTSYSAGPELARHFFCLPSTVMEEYSCPREAYRVYACHGPEKGR
jgi:hypothetical protein